MPDVRTVTIYTDQLDTQGVALLYIVLAMGDGMLDDLGFNLHLIIQQMVYCSDGFLLDDCAFDLDFTLYLGRKSLRMSIVSSEAKTDQTTSEVLAERRRRTDVNQRS